MRKFALALLFMVTALPAFAVEGSEVVFAGGSVPGLTAGAAGSLDLTRGAFVLLRFPGQEVEIPYDRIRSYEHTQEVAVHLGVAPAIAVGLVKKRRKNHYLRITFADKADVAQVVVLEIPKTMPRVIMPLLAVRATGASKPTAGR